VKVLLVHNRYRSAQPSGENAVVEDEAQLLAECGCEVARLELESDAIASWPLYRKATLPGRVVWSQAGYRATRGAICRLKPDVVHFHNTFPLFSPSALWAARRSGIPVVQTLHNFRPLCPAGTFLRKGRICEACLGRAPLPAVRHGCYRGSRLATTPVALMDVLHGALETWRRCVDVFVCVSEFMRSKYVQAGWSADRLVVKYNTVPTPQVPPIAASGGFVCLSRLTAEKGVDVLLEAWGQAFASGQSQLLIAGSGADEAKLRQRAERLRGVTFGGFMPREVAMQALAGAQAAIVPSLCAETFSRVVAEAFSVGVPVIASRIGALPEIIDHGRTGLLVEPASPAALADALRLIADSDVFRRSLGSQARRAFHVRFSPDAGARKLIDLYAAAPARKVTC
jgi:glycosyltransferase involved in cell wall biosynthesis